MDSPNTQIAADIEKWSEQRLNQWFLDSISRYEMMGICPQTAFARTTTILLMDLAKILANSDAKPKEAGLKLASAIQFIRERHRERQEP